MKQTSKHGAARCQQRGIPPLIVSLLDDFGSEEHVGNGCTFHYFDRQALRRMESELGGAVVRLLSQWHRCYKVRAADGTAVTVGHRYKHLKRK